MKNKIFQDQYDKNKAIFEYKDFIVAKGGDGTLLKAINLFKYKNKPFFGIAAGTENFLMNDSKKFEIFDNAKFKKFRLIKVEVTYMNLERNLASLDDHYVEKKSIFQAFNDIFISEENGWIDFNCKDKDNILGKFKGSGLIFSTPQGSTGINKNNGGVILPLSSKSWSITGDKTNRKINYILLYNKIKIKVKSRKIINLFIDGNNHKITNVTKVKIYKGDTITVVFNEYEKFKSKRKI